LTREHEFVASNTNSKSHQNNRKLKTAFIVLHFPQTPAVFPASSSLPMIRSAQFWQDESDATLLSLNHGFIEPNPEGNVELLARCATWLTTVCGDEFSAPEVPLDPVQDPERLFVADAERTFAGESSRQLLITLLTHLTTKFGDYQQSLSFVTSFLSLFLDPQEVVAIVTELNTNTKYLPGYWKAEAVDFAIGAVAIFFYIVLF
jgi:hypothetical protein